MNYKAIIKGALAAVLLIPAQSLMAQDSNNLVFRGVMQDWYTYGKNSDTGKTEWYQVGPGYYDMATGQLFSNQGVFEICLDLNSTKEDKFVGMDFVMRHNVCYGNAGSIKTNNALYTFFFHETSESQATNEEVGNEDYEILIRKWDIEKGTYETIGRLNNSPTDLTYDPIDDKVYGIFRIISGEGESMDYAYELCELDMQTFEVRQISHEQFDYFYEPRALAINSMGEIYGINQRGMVLKFDKTTGACTEVGNIGFRTQEKMMSAAFDFRTDKLYWLGYKNDAVRYQGDTSGTNNTLTVKEGGRDTGLYEIDTKTGVATLLSNCEQVNVDIEAATVTKIGKVVLTGLWVEGGFEAKEQDLKIEALNVPNAIKTGETVEVSFQVKNVGTKAMGEDDWSVILKANGVEVAKKSGRDLEPGEVREVKFSYTAPEKVGRVKLSAEIVSALDEEERNNNSGNVSVAIYNDEDSAVEHLHAQDKQNAIYTISGQRVLHMDKHGLYIVNGKTIVK